LYVREAPAAAHLSFVGHEPTQHPKRGLTQVVEWDPAMARKPVCMAQFARAAAGRLVPPVPVGSDPTPGSDRPAPLPALPDGSAPPLMDPPVAAG
jgi:hypothetical protein